MTVAVLLRGAGARFGLLHGSRVAGSARADSDVDVVVLLLREGVVARV